MNFIGKLAQLRDAASEYLEQQVKEKGIIILVDLEPNKLPDEFYELPSQYLFKIWKLEWRNNQIVAHGYDIELGETHEFIDADDQLDWVTQIELANYIAPEGYDEPELKSYVLISTQNEWLATGLNENAEQIAATIAEVNDRFPDRELIFFETINSYRL